MYRNAFNKKFLNEKKNNKEDNCTNNGISLEKISVDKKPDLMELEDNNINKNDVLKSGKNSVESKEPVFSDSSIFNSGMKRRILRRNDKNFKDQEDEEDLDIEITFPKNETNDTGPECTTTNAIENTLKFKEWATQKTFYDKTGIFNILTRFSCS